MNLIVSDIFSSIQGEGKNLGKPSVFLRLGICNLHCTWCDTPYTWKKGMTDYKNITIDQVAKKIHQLAISKKINNLVITGGEPLLQQNALAVLLQKPQYSKFTIEFETNGSIKLLSSFQKILPKRKITFNISPKLADSGNQSYDLQLYPRSVLKFVYISKKSEEWINQFTKKYQKQIKKMPIYIMPEGTSVKAMEAKYKDALAFCSQKHYIFTPRLHIYLFGNKRAT